MQEFGKMVCECQETELVSHDPGSIIASSISDGKYLLIGILIIPGIGAKSVVRD